MVISREWRKKRFWFVRMYILRADELDSEVPMVGRNDPCPCGSGRKYKKCCLLKLPGPGDRKSGELRFEPGSYGGRDGYMPSLACFKESSSGEKDYRFVLANPSCVVDFEHDAVVQATADFSNACRVDDATGSSEALGRHLDTVSKTARSFGFDCYRLDTHESVGPALAYMLARRYAQIKGSRAG